MSIPLSILKYFKMMTGKNVVVSIWLSFFNYFKIYGAVTLTICLSINAVAQLIDFSRDGQAAARPSIVLVGSQTVEPSPRLQAAVHSLTSFLESSVRIGEWSGPQSSLSDAVCGDAAPKLAYALSKLGFEVDVIKAEFHYYIQIRENGRLFFIDPTIGQFFAKGSMRQKIFLGSWESLTSFFRLNLGKSNQNKGLEEIYLRNAIVDNAAMKELEKSISAYHNGRLKSKGGLILNANLIPQSEYLHSNEEISALQTGIVEALKLTAPQVVNSCLGLF